MFGYKLIHKTQLEHYRKTQVVYSKTLECHRWFGSFKELDVIWDYILNRDRGYGSGIWEARAEYARRMKRTAYNEPLKEMEK